MPELSRRALNRATLARQLLLGRSPMPVADALTHLVGLQAQAPNPPYVALWARLAGFRPDQLSALITDRRAVRIALMRSTIHLVGAADSRVLRPWVQPVLDRGLHGGYGPRLAGLDLAELADAGRKLVEEEPRTFTQLGAALRERWPDAPAAALNAAVRTLVPLVQVPPRGLWGASGQATHTSLESWLGAGLDAEPPVDRLVLRYLGAFGPASALDVQTWCGLTRLGEVLDRLRPGLVTFRDARGRELFDLPDAPRPDPDTPAPVRLLGEFDNLLLSHADRSRILDAEYRSRLFTVNGIIRASVLVDGFVQGSWKYTRQRGTATVAVEPFVRFSKPVTAAITREAERFLAFAAPDATTRDIVLR